jgi:sulfotransferase
MKSFEQMFFIGGLPRTGSSLLTAILSQNPDMLSEGTSGLLGLMKNVEAIFERDGGLKHALQNTNRRYLDENLKKAIPHFYYEERSAKYVIDKNRHWVHPLAIETIKNHITDNPKIIVMLRPIQEIAESIYFIAQENDDIQQAYAWMYGGDPLISPFDALKQGITTNKENFLFVTYDQLVLQTQETMNRIYDFFEIERFEHQLDEVDSTNVQEGDYHLMGLHEIREKIEKREKNVELPEELLNRALYLQKDLEIAFNKAGIENVF